METEIKPRKTIIETFENQQSEVDRRRQNVAAISDLRAREAIGTLFGLPAEQTRPRELTKLEIEAQRLATEANAAHAAVVAAESRIKQARAEFDSIPQRVGQAKMAINKIVNRRNEMDDKILSQRVEETYRRIFAWPMDLEARANFAVAAGMKANKKEILSVLSEEEERAQKDLESLLAKNVELARLIQAEPHAL
jgi:hypothetical protein